MQEYNCVIIEDEPIAAEILESYIADIPFLTLKGVANDAIAALNMLRSDTIDLIFLDIHLPRISGIEFIKTLKNPPHVIITTAYGEFALKSYELNIVDYLMKPIEFSRFLQAINKLKLMTSPLKYSSSVHIPDGKEFMFINSGKKKVRLHLKDIIYVESLKEYVHIFTKNDVYTSKFQLGQFEEKLSKSDFLRIHRSFIVTIEKIEAYTSTSIEINGKELPIGRSYKELVMNVLQGSGV